jgi:hypothetical protein
MTFMAYEARHDMKQDANTISCPGEAKIQACRIHPLEIPFRSAEISKKVGKDNGPALRRATLGWT